MIIYFVIIILFIIYLAINIGYTLYQNGYNKGYKDCRSKYNKIK